MPDAGSAGRAETPDWSGAFRADAVLAAGAFVDTIIKALATGAFPFEYTVVPDFFGNRGTILAGLRSDGFETEALVEIVLDLVSEFLGEMFILVHDTSFPAGCRNGS